HFGAGLSLADAVARPEETAALALTAPSGVSPVEHASWWMRWLHAVRAHVEDVASFEPLPLVAVFALAGKYRARGACWAAGIVAAHAGVCAIAGQTGVAPGAGAAGLAVLLPIDHALVALAL